MKIGVPANSVGFVQLTPAFRKRGKVTNIYNSDILSENPNIITAENVGTNGTGLFIDKTGATLNFKNLFAADSYLTLTDNTTDDQIDFTVNTEALKANLDVNSFMVKTADETRAVTATYEPDTVLYFDGITLGTLYRVDVALYFTQTSGISRNATFRFALTNIDVYELLNTSNYSGFTPPGITINSGSYSGYENSFLFRASDLGAGTPKIQVEYRGTTDFDLTIKRYSNLRITEMVTI